MINQAMEIPKDLGITAKNNYARFLDSVTNQSKKMIDIMSMSKNKQSDKEDSENNSQLQSDKLEDAMGNEPEEAGKKKRSGRSDSASGK